MLKKLKRFAPFAFLALPVLALAQNPRTTGSVTNLQGAGDLFLGIIGSYVVPIIFALAFVVFLWGVFQYVKSAGDEAARETGKNHMIWGIVGLFVMGAVWGLVRVVSQTVGIPTGQQGQKIIPPLPGQN